MNETEIKALIREQLPDLIANDPNIRDFIARAISNYYAGRQETESRFDQMIRLMQQEREEDRRKWEEHLAKHDREFEENRLRWEENNRRWEENKLNWQENNRRWEENDRRWEENKLRWEENNRRWEENKLRWEENERRWEENNRRWEENNQRWEENTHRWEHNDQLHAETKKELNKLGQRIESGISAMGARWGINSEAAFRNGLKGILEDSFGIEVINFMEFDQEGTVFDRPDQVEIDLIIKNGTVILCELKSSMSKSDMLSFARKIAYYENHHRKATRKIVISPMIHPSALSLAKELGIETYSFADQIELD